MKDRGRTWLSIGIFALAGTALTPLPGAGAVIDGAGTREQGKPLAPAPLALPDLIRLAAGGEGGEGGEAGESAVPESYALPGSDPNGYKYDAAAEIAAYARGVHESYVAAAAEAHKFETAVKAFLADPNDATLAAARRAWVGARPAYLVTETFRFYDGPIEALEGRINSWPLDESFIDYVQGKPSAGLVNDTTTAMTINAIIGRDQVGDEDQVTTGWHAIEFLLWGQDLNPDGPGNRPASDYLAGKGNNDRRRTYLELVTAQLVADLDRLADEWAPDQDNYARIFLALPPREALGRVMNGMAVLAGFEFMSERLAVGLDSGDQEDEHSCFSDTTHQDFVYDLKGIADVWNGVMAGGKGSGIAALVARLDPALAKKVDGLLAEATAKVAALGDPWDKVLASPPGSPGRQAGEAAVTALQALGAGLKQTGERLGVLVQIPTG
jgi:putative iron-regulated protein